MSDDQKTFILRPQPHLARFNALLAVQKAPDGYVVEIRPPKRTDAQNRKLHAMLGDVASQQTCYGHKLTVEEWKRWFSAGLWQQKIVPGMEGGFVMLGEKTSNMSIKKINEMIELISFWGSQPEHWVNFKEPDFEPVGRDYHFNNENDF